MARARSHTLIFSVWKSKLIWEVPGDRHHSGPQPVKIPQAGKITAADASLFEGQQGRHPSGLSVLFNLLPVLYDADPVGIWFQFRVKQIDQFHCRIKRILLTSEMHKHGKILQKIISLLHFIQIDLEMILQHGVMLPLLSYMQKLRNGITMHIHNLHNTSSLFRFEKGRACNASSVSGSL